jgi:NTP pyrophosphatase (non-canonical NTP hydrolase)
MAVARTATMMINELSKQIFENNKAKGFYDSEKNIGEMLCLIHSEVSEALECDRKDRECASRMSEINGIAEDEAFKTSFEEKVKDTFQDELADIMIRVMDLAAFRGVDLEEHIKAKMRYNSLRPYKHGKKY